MLQPHQRFGDYEIIRLLGRGGMGEVYEAQQFHPLRRVALKVLAPWLAQNDEALDRFWREANVPAQLDHPCVVRIIATDKTPDGVAYYTMQLVRGISLADLLRKGGETLPETLPQPAGETSHSDSGTPVDNGVVAGSPPPSEPAPPVLLEYRRDPFRTLARIGAQAARALASAHRQGYLHRDIKPSNLMVDHHGQLYLVDFGLTRALDSATGTRVGILVGTPWYMSPEQAQGQPLDQRSDIYSLGVTLYQLATGGKGPYRASREDSDAVLREIRSGTLEPVEKLADTIPSALARIITRAVHPAADKRYQTADAVARDLEEYLQPGAGAATREFRAPRLHRLQPWLVGALAVVMSALTLGIFFFFQGADRGNPPEVPEQDPFHRQREVGVPIHLLGQGQKPVRSLALLKDVDGGYWPLASELVVQGKGAKPFFLALDHPKIANFKFTVEMRAIKQVAAAENDLGVFWGWREHLRDTQAAMRFFVLMLDTRPILKHTHGRLYIGTWQFNEVKAKGGALAIWEQNPRMLHQGRGWIPLPDPAKVANGWHRIEITIRDQRFSVALNAEPAESFDVDWVLRTDKGLTRYDLDCRGMLGVWVRNGLGHFRNMTVLPLPAN
jgi:serine/threonine protein kinase